jgi:hypothetical protein
VVVGLTVEAVVAGEVEEVEVAAELFSVVESTEHIFCGKKLVEVIIVIMEDKMVVVVGNS